MEDNYGVTDYGFQRPTYEEIRNDMLTKAREVFGPDWNLGLTSVTGLLIRSVAFPMWLLWSALGVVYNSIFPATASGKSLEYIADGLGLTRQSATRATGVATFAGDVDTQIPSGTEVTNSADVEGPIFEVLYNRTVQDRGEVDVEIRAAEAGADGNIGAGYIDAIVDTISGIETVDNEMRDDILALGAAEYAAETQAVAPGETISQTVSVDDILHELNVATIHFTVQNPTDITQTYFLQFEIIDNATDEVITNIRSASYLVDAVGDQVIEIEPQSNLRNVDEIRIRMTASANNAENIEVVYDDTNSYANGSLIYNGSEITNADWVAELTSATPGETSGGADAETDTELLGRYYNSLALAGESTVDAIRASVLSVDGVRAALVTENVEITEVDGIPPKAFEAVVQGGADTPVAQAIFETKPAGIEAHGAINAEVLDDIGNVRTISFTRPTTVDIDVTLTLTLTADYPAQGDVIVRDNVIGYIGGTLSTGEIAAGLGIGEDVIISKIIDVVHNVEGVADVTVEAAKDGEALGTDNITIAGDELATTATGRIII